jgi:peptidoglycan/LPS O-acetylase OafA/YrhL
LRRDIQFLRGIAVLVVVLYHSNLGILNQGYLGVDVFFVLSGFLITSIILKSLDNNNFSFSGFYLRRAKRLLPALYSTLLFTTLISLVVLTNLQWIDYLAQLKGALTFTANIVLPMQTGYFESASDGKPLLHIWSLSLEEQYYFLLPLILYFLPKNWRIMGIALLTLISLYWCFSWVYSENQEAPLLWRIADSSKSDWAFYLLFTRAWELLAGSLCAWLMLYRPNIETPLFLLVAL